MIIGMEIAESLSVLLILYTEELNKQLNEVIEIVKREFMYKVGKYGKKMSALTFAMNGCPTVYCGGGSTFHRMRISPRYFSDVRMVGKDTLSIPNLKNRTIPNELYTILATSYGLSVPQIESIFAIILTPYSMD